MNDLFHVCRILHKIKGNARRNLLLSRVDPDKARADTGKKYAASGISKEGLISKFFLRFWYF